MSDMEINRVVSQMRALASEINTPSNAVATPANADAKAVDDVKFSNVLRGAIDSVNDTQSAASRAVDGFLTGDNSRSLAEVMVETQKANVSFKAMTEVRNRLIEAYREVMNMPI
ncbi:MAG: flagellar hook-basal body complex protein FliE [Gammaproteobacteria bacterium]